MFTMKSIFLEYFIPSLCAFLIYALAVKVDYAHSITVTNNSCPNASVSWDNSKTNCAYLVDEKPNEWMELKKGDSVYFAVSIVSSGSCFFESSYLTFNYEEGNTNSSFACGKSMGSFDCNQPSDPCLNVNYD